MWHLQKGWNILAEKEIFAISSYSRQEIPKSPPAFKNLTHLITAWWWHIKLGTSVTCGTLPCLVLLTSQLKQLSTLWPLLWLSVVFGTQPRIRIWSYSFGFVAFPWAALTLSPLSDQTTEKKSLHLLDCVAQWLCIELLPLIQTKPASYISLHVLDNFIIFGRYLVAVILQAERSWSDSFSLILTILTGYEIILYLHNLR